MVLVRPFARKSRRVITEGLDDVGVSSKSEGCINIHERALRSRRPFVQKI